MRVLTGMSLMYHEILAGGKESEDVQFKSSRSPISYSACKFPVICGPSLGKSENIDPQMAENVIDEKEPKG